MGAGLLRLGTAAGAPPGHGAPGAGRHVLAAAGRRAPGAFWRCFTCWEATWPAPAGVVQEMPLDFVAGAQAGHGRFFEMTVLKGCNTFLGLVFFLFRVFFFCFFSPFSSLLV